MLMNTSQKNILLIEDSPVQALNICKLLENQPVTVACAANGIAGVKLARQALPDLILLDVEMPGINGLEVCRLLHDNELTRKIPIILFTTHTEVEPLCAGFADGGTIDFIPKDGFYEAVLLETLREMKMFEPNPVSHEAKA